MGFIDKLRAELIDIIEWVDDSRHTLVWRFPRYQNEIKHGAQLIVRPGQAAIFVHRGRIADVFGPGQVRLETANLPVLATLAGWKYGFNSPFKAEVYFVSTRQVTDLKWGTPSPVMMRDHDFGPVRVRGFGTYTLRAKDPKRLLTELVGTDAAFEADEIHELMRAIVSQAFADVVGKSEIALLDLASHYAELSEEVRRVAEGRIDDEYGLEIPQLVLVNVSVPAEVEQALDARTSVGVIGDLNAFQSYQLSRSLPAAAANPAGGLAGAGVGVGMGMALAGRFAEGHGPAGATPPPAPAVWHIAEGGRSVGPLSVEDIARAAAQGRVTPDTLVWSAGLRDWTPARAVPALASLFAATPPPLPR
ncbi:MAG TPA: SPFH domain-containing protein [Myxococcota bacterium]|nr:SPFH domain-containing protein [Myxococcota bacterium]